MDGKLHCSSGKMKIKDEERCFHEDCSMKDASDQIDIKEGLIKPEYELADEWVQRDNVEPDYFKFVTPKDVKVEDADVLSTIASKSDPINIEKGTFICHYCKRAFTTPEYCEKHTRKCRNRMYDQPSTSSDIVSVSAVLEKKTSLTRYQESHSQCQQCDYKFKSRSGLYLHARKHSGVVLPTCKECNKQFAAPSKLAIHMLIHSKEKPHKCKQCEAAFNQAGHLKMHILTHTGVRAHKCTQCGKSFTNPSNLISHMRIHTIEKPYQCTQCSKSFTQSGVLTRHLRTHTGEKPYKCTQCSKSFTLSFKLTEHVKKSHR